MALYSSFIFSVRFSIISRWKFANSFIEMSLLSFGESFVTFLLVHLIGETFDSMTYVNNNYELPQRFGFTIRDIKADHEDNAHD